jgi:tRNA pseudouridine32 synthase/23S rRNA pseudouridine746 synthase
MQVSIAWHTIDLPILVDWPNRPLRKIALENGKPSITRFRCVASDAITNTSRLELEPLTGRSHQLRVHLQAMGHPIVGDALYNQASNITSQPAMTGAAHLHLHACELGLEHPVNGTLVRWHCPATF